MHLGLHLVESIEIVGFSSSESEFGASINSTTLAWTSYSSLSDFGFTFRSSLSFVTFLDEFVCSVD